MTDLPRDKENRELGTLVGRHRLDLIRLFAGYQKERKAAPSKALAKQYGVSISAIRAFKNRHQREIDNVCDKLEDEYAGLWIAKKRNRIAELQEMADILERAIADCPDSDMIRARAQLLKQVSEELGQLPPRQQVVSAQVTHVVEGFTSDELRDILT